MKYALALSLVTLAASLNAVAGVPGNPVRPRILQPAQPSLVGLICQGMKGGDYVTLSAVSETELEFDRSEPLGGMLPAFKQVEKTEYKLVSAEQDETLITAKLVANVMFAGSGSQTATLSIRTDQENAQETNAKLNVEISTFDESLGQPSGKLTIYQLSCSFVETQ
jgi:hypothetical protein